MDLKTVDRQPVRVACLRHTGPFTTLEAFWRDHVGAWLKSNDLNVVTYGIARDDPATTEAERLRYDACAEVPEGFLGTGLYHLALVPGGKYVVAKFHGTASQIGAAWGELMGGELAGSGLAFDTTRWPLERYDRNFTTDPETGAFDCELLVPVEDASAPKPVVP